MSGDYLWDKSGPPDPDVQKLEAELGKLRHRPRPLPEVASQADGAPDAHSSPEPVRRSPRPGRGRVIAVVFGLAAAAALFLLIRGRLLVPQSGGLATAQRFSGMPSAPWARLDARLRPGEWLETGASWEAQVAIADIGRIQLAPQTRVRLAESAASPDGVARHRLELAHGRIHAKVVAPPKVFVVGTPAAEAVDLGCEYTLEVDPKGDGWLAVTWGWVELGAGTRRSVVPAGARCRIQHGFGPGTPYFEDASEALRTALDRFDFEHGGREDVAKVLAEARRHDALTLWHLIPRVEEGQRREVYLRLKSLVPPPASCSEHDVMELNEGPLEAWKNGLAVTW